MRSYKKIRKKHLTRLKNITLSDQKNFMKKYPKYKLFKMFAILLIQGAAQHYKYGKNGINDFDILILYSRNKKGKTPFPYRRKKSYDCAMPEFGRYYKYNKKYENRRIDIMMRELPLRFQKDSIRKTLREYFQDEKGSVKHWRKKPVIGLWRNAIFGKTMWESNEMKD